MRFTAFNQMLYFLRARAIKFILLFILSSVSFANATNFEFFGTNKRLKYNIKEVSSEISKEYKIEFRVTSLVVASKDCGDNFKKQFRAIENLDAESNGLIFISACVKEENEHGYHTSTSVAHKILNGANDKLLIYSPDGDEIYQGEYIQKSDSILELINEYNQRLQ